MTQQTYKVFSLTYSSVPNEGVELTSLTDIRRKSIILPEPSEFEALFRKMSCDNGVYTFYWDTRFWNNEDSQLEQQEFKVYSAVLRFTHHINARSLHGKFQNTFKMENKWRAHCVSIEGNTNFDVTLQRHLLSIDLSYLRDLIPKMNRFIQKDQEDGNK